MVSDCDILDDINSSNNSCILEGGTVENNPLYDGITFGTHDDLTINRHSWGNNESLNSSRLTGYVDELRISNSIRYHDNFTPPSAQFHNDSNTIGLWNFNEGSGDTVYDISGNENHGILYGAEHSPTLINVDGFGEMYYAGAFNNSYYYYTFSNTFDWSSANVNAAALNASLLDITPPNEINFITPQLFDGFNYWISNNQLINANGDLVTGDGLHDVIIETSVMLGTHPTSAANGCTNPIADNYTVTAQIEDGSCLYSSLVYEDLTELNSDLAEDLSVFEAIEEEQNYSMSFDSNEYVNLFGNEDFNFGIGDFTISLWFKSLVTESFENTLEILGKRPISWTGNNNYYYDIQLSSSGLTSYNVPYTSEPSVIFHWNSEPHPGAFHAYSPFNLLDEQWHYLTVSKEGILLKVFLNGVLVSEQDRFPTENQTADNDGPLLIGNYAGSNHAPFLLESINIWDEAIESTTIQYHMTCPPTGEEEGLVGYWKFNESIGDTVYDLSGNGNHGVIYGGATFSTDVPESYSGCTDELALNYDETALCDNGSCVYVDEIISNLEDVISTVNSELDNTVSSLNDVIDTWQSSIDLTNESLDAISGISQMLNSFNSVIDLSEGWNMIGYGCPEPMDVEESLSDYTDLILIAKANNGSAYLPEYGFNGIGNFTPGYGYQLKTSESIEEFSLCYNYTVIDNTQFTEIEIDNAQMQNDVNCLTGNPQIGDYCYGGIVFYVVEGEEGKYGLVAASEDLEGTYEWGCYGESVVGENGISIGTGYQNTMDILNQDCEIENGEIIAAQAVFEHQSEGYSDWFLPSNDELIEMYNTIGNGGPNGNTGNFVTTTNYISNYWSSSEYSINYPWYIWIYDGGAYNTLVKNGEATVRPIRSFGDWTEGCMDSLACNFNTEANMSDGSCTYAEDGYNCEGFILITQTNIHSAVDDWLQDSVLTESLYGHISDWDVSSVTDMSYMFEEATTFNNNLSGWDVSSVTDMNHMFRGATNFDGDISTWDVSSVTDMNHMFAVTSIFNSDLSSWDVSNVLNMHSMFGDAYGFNQDLSSWDVSSVTNMPHMFNNATSFNQDLSNWDVSSVTDMTWMFINATSLSEENKCAIQQSFSSNENWPYEWECPNIMVGCTDPLADNYDGSVNLDDSSCIGSPVNPSDFIYAGEHNGHYYYNSFEGTFDALIAFDLCTLNGGYLVSISSEEENLFVSEINSGQMFIGLQRVGGNWIWADGQNLTFDNWSPNQPDGNADFVLTNYLGIGNGLWDDNSDGGGNSFVLEIEP